MNNVDPLPPVLQSKFGQLQRRIRAARLVRGLAGGTMLVLGLFLAAFLIEALIGWPVAGLRGANVVIVSAAASALMATLVIWRRPLPRRHLAALVERRFPELGERLASTVELRKADDGLHGSPALIHWLGEETVQRAAPLDFRQAYSIRTSRKLAGIALALVLLCVTPLIGSDSYARFGRRLLLAWSPSVYGYTLDVVPGDQYVARGRSAAVTVQLTALEEGVRLPATCVLIDQEGTAPSRRLRMEPVDAATFSLTWPVVQDSLTYRVEAGDLASATYRLEAVDPVALLPGNPTAEVAPPPYVPSDVIPPSAHAGQAPFTALQYSRVRFSFAFDRPAHKATIRWRADANEQTIAMPLSADRRAATWEVLAKQVGPHAATLTLEAEHGIVSSYALPAWSVWADEAPWFSVAPVLGFAGSADRPKVVAPDETIPIKAAADDQVGVDRIELEYRINDGALQIKLLAEGQGQVRVATDATWRLHGLVKIGDVIRCRLRVADKRRLKQGEVSAAGQSAPDRDLGPNVAYLPSKDKDADRWWSFKVEAGADSLVKQHVLAQRDEFNAWIERIKKQLEQERQQVRKVKLASHQMPVLTQEQATQLAAAHKLNQMTQQELRALGRKASPIDGLQNLARLSFDIAGRELGDADQALVAGQAKSLAAAKRETALGKADKALQSALERLGVLRKMNELLAQELLDVQDLQKLAHQEEELAKQAEAAAAEPKMNAKDLERLRAEQAKIAARLQELAEKNPRLRQAALKARQAQTQQLAKQAHSLAMNQRKLSQEAEAKWQAELKAKFADLAKQQRDLAGTVEKLGRDVKAGPAGEFPNAPHRPALDAADRLRDGQIEAALGQQQAAQHALQAAADQLDKALILGRDPRAAIQKLARMQDDLVKQLEKFGEEYPRLPAATARARMAEITTGQKALHDAIGKLDVPKSQEKARQDVHDITGEAAKLLARSDALAGFYKMEQARDALQAWAGQFPKTPPKTESPKTGSPAGNVTPEELTVKTQAQESRRLAKKQHDLREATRKLLAEPAKAQGGSAESTRHQEEVDKLSKQLMELSQQAGPEAKNASQEAAHAAQLAQKAMAKGQADKEQGRMAEAQDSEAESALQLQMAGKKLDEAAAAMAKAQGKDDPNDAALQEAFRDSQMKLEQAQQQLGQTPNNAPKAMRQAAQALGQTVQQAHKQMAAQPRPMGGGEPAPSFQGAASEPAQILAEQLKAHAGKAWGELPGELRTRIVQDLRARYGDEYGPIIQRYFQQIADVPPGKKNE